MHSEARPLHTTLAQLVAQGADAARVADAAVAVWRDIDAILSPIVGHRGVAALYKRSLYLARDRHAYLAAVHKDERQSGEFDGLHAALSQQTAAGAAAANDALVQTFCDLLASLIGASLTERLLAFLWDNPSSGTAAQENLP